MMFSRLGFINKNQRGFTLIELLVAIAISGLITSGLTLTIFQVFGGNARNSSEMTVIRQVQNAGHWVSRDTLMAQVVEPGASSGCPLILTWTDWEGAIHLVEYTITDGKIRRSHYVDGVPSAETLVAQYIDSSQTLCQFSDGMLTLTVTAAIGGYKPASETRTYEITPRPS